jgi:hypothetical protein
MGWETSIQFPLLVPEGKIFIQERARAISSSSLPFSINIFVSCQQRVLLFNN